jgi:hypothetical protein
MMEERVRARERFCMRTKQSHEKKQILGINGTQLMSMLIQTTHRCTVPAIFQGEGQNLPPKMVNSSKPFDLKNEDCVVYKKL